ncbi:MAG: translation elongation factor 4 [Defluviitoga tunisiensis]|uniref:Elongation factor 4 n=1 Tax=Defluviitoga tunisiensis TaxID=1006576 RepID=A0A0C7P4S6_DEFTU|nr:translation elongation factor 4 [Defluviitoga tunisiensis]MDD3601052.1 translation elongation factor 4 [Defluviitoga tunisiensis]CEP78834.1 Elongation factor 4 [Defluviitoga tunisiensis]HHV02220.1 elongation factor 4 [Defluviitoga tunisiensis]HOB54917.1 translation elongation factor 4 [Defluviitoga tunisiensis]HPP10611.1 translation elongation factor 4 [Defluviitoga tunisiensis]
MYDPNFIRNVAIIAHIDHGKTTLMDRILELTHSIDERNMREQFLDSMDLEREKGITIKSHPVKVFYTSKKGQDYELNILDTPGHIDFTYEVSRSLAACEGAILLVDATQGVQAQTVTNTYLALENDLEIIGAINKIDLPSANVEETLLEINDLVGIDSDSIVKISAKTGEGVSELLELIIEKVPPPTLKGSINDKLKALVFDAKYDKYRGIIVYTRVFAGTVKKEDNILFMASGKSYEVSEVGVFHPEMVEIDNLSAGEIGYIIAGIKEIQEAKVGDTITNAQDPTDKPLPGYKEVKPMVYAGLYPGLPEYYEDLRKALEKLKLNDASLVFLPENSPALGYGFRVGFLGLLHMEIVKERIQREFDLAVILTVPSVIYNAKLKNGEVIQITNPSQFPDQEYIESVYEPYCKLDIITPPEFMGDLINLAQVEKRGEFLYVSNAGKNRVVLHFEIPLAEIIFDFFDKMKALSKGYASMDYELIGYRESKLVKIEIYINKEKVDALSYIVHESKAYEIARKLVDKLKDLIPRHQFEIPIQAYCKGKIIARSTIKALRKDVLQKCYGGDVTRKMKLLEKQKEGKKRMREIGEVSIPQEAFLALLKIDEDNN